MFLCLYVASSISVAAPFGCLFIAFSLDRIGRIATFKFSLWPCFIGWMLIGFAYDPIIIIIGRLFTGFAMSMAILNLYNFYFMYFNVNSVLAIGSNSANVYMAEISSPKLRGSMMSISSVMLSFGKCNVYYFSQDFLILKLFIFY